MSYQSIVLSLVAVCAIGGVGTAQKLTPADVAQKLTGTWVFNKELSKGFSTPGGRPGGRGPGRGALFAIAAPVGQRGGGGQTPSTPSDLSPDEIAAMNAMRQLQQVAEAITIKASPEQVMFMDARGERQYPVDGKNTRIQVAGADVTVKSRWDKAMLRQEFSTVQSKLTQTWEVDADDRLVLVAKIESLRLRTPDQRAVFDRKQ